MTAVHPVSAAEEPRTIARRLCAASPLIAEVVVSREPDGTTAVIRLDPLIVRSRAIQQGLADHSIAAAAADARVQRAVADAVDRVNAALPSAAGIASHHIARDGD